MMTPEPNPDQLRLLDYVFEQAAPCAVSDMEGRVLRCNPAFAHLVGRQSVEVVGFTHDQLGLAYWPHSQSMRAELLRDGDSVQFEHECRGRDSGPVPIDVRMVLHRDAPPSSPALLIYLADLTERHCAQSSLQASESRFQLLVDSLRDHAVVMVDTCGNFQTWNRGAFLLFGYHSEEMIGQPLRRLLPLSEDECNVQNRELTEPVVADKAGGEGWRVRKDGTRFWAHFNTTPLYQNGKLTGFANITRDLTERKKAEQDLIERERRLLGLLGSTMDAIISIDDRQRIVLFNAAAENMFGYRASDVLGQRLEMLIPERSRPDHEAHVRQFGQTGVTRRQMGKLGTVRGVRADGQEFPVEASISQTVVGGETLFTAIVRDITERVQAEENLQRNAEELRRSNQDLEQFAYVASHDLQEPLRAVAGCIQIVQRRYASQLPSAADELIGHTVDGVTRMQTLINDLLSFSRIATRGKSFEPSDANRVLAAALANLETAVRDSQAVVTHDPLPVVRVDATQLAQVFQNLIGNAIKFQGDHPPRIHVGIRRDKRDWLFSIRDNGIGIEPEYFERIFILFQRLHTRTEYSGTGIGLAICKKIVERHGGRIWLESSPGKGTTFYFTIPDRDTPHGFSESGQAR